MEDELFRDMVGALAYILFMCGFLFVGLAVIKAWVFLTGRKIK